MHGWLAFVTALFAVVGAIFVFGAFYGVSYFGLGEQVIIALAVALLVAAGIAAWLLYIALRAQYTRVKTGREALIGAFGVVTTEIKPKGEVRVNGEFWQAAAAKGAAISNGQTVRVVGMEGMFLVVEAAEEKA
jgi:membrane-bound serine protease (ClpP class)